jgi:hypothetical protein
MSKKLNTNSITNELEHSSFFPARPQAASQSASSETAPTATLQAPVPQTIPSAAVTRPKAVAAKPLTKQPKATPETDRGYVRRTFDIFEDQLEYLTRASLEDRLAGGEGSMNAMVRQALDDFIAHQKRR